MQRVDEQAAQIDNLQHQVDAWLLSRVLLNISCYLFAGACHCCNTAFACKGMRDATEAKHWFTTEEQSRLASERLQQAAAAEQVQTRQFSCTVASFSR